MRKIFVLLIVLAGLIQAGCKRDLADNPVIIFPVNSLVLTVNGADYIAKPSLVNGQLNDTLVLSVQKPNDTAYIKQLTLSPGLTTEQINKEYLLFNDNLSSITVNGSGGSTVYHIRMEFQPAPSLYVPLSSEGYTVVPGQTQVIAAANYDNFYEGFIRFGSSWLGFFIVTPTVPMVRYGVNAGFGDGVTQVLHETTGDAPWGDWGINALWRFSYNSTTLALTVDRASLAITGSSTGGTPIPIEYNQGTRLLTVTTDLSPGTFLFDAQTFPAYKLGVSGTGGKLASNGNAIEVAEAGNYTITLDLRNPPYYLFEMVKN